MALLDDLSKPLSLGRAQWFVGGKVELEPFDIEGVRKQDLRFQPRLDDPCTLEVAPCPVENLTNCPAYCQSNPPSPSTPNSRYCRIE